MSSFSLPSHGGVVSLLNDAQPTKNLVDKSTLQTRPALLERESSGSSSALSTISNSLDSSFDGGKDSHSSTFSSINSNGSSTGSLENGKIADIHSLRSKLEVQSVLHSGDNLKKREASELRDSSDEDETVSIRKTRSKEVRPTYTKSNSSQADQILNQTRIAASPKPLNESSFSSDDNKDVPMNMHKATSMSEKDNEASTKTASDTVSGETTETSATPTPSNAKRRYPCSYPNCEKTFSTSGHAARHNRIHTGSKPYRCTFPGCNASFSRQDNSLQHYRTHVLHPKNRSNGGTNTVADRQASMDGSGISPSSSEGPQSLDADIQATVRMGRKALEEGTAIAVVHEIVDGNGKRGEAVQRMVGQPRGSRRGSNSTNLSDLKERDALSRRSKAVEEGDDDDDSMSVGTSWSYNNHPSYSHHHTHPPPTIVHGDYSGYPSHHNMTYPPANSSPSHRHNGGRGPYTSAPHYRMHTYQQGSPNYFSGHDYFPTKYSSSSHFDTVRRRSANSLSYLPQSNAANRAANAAARRFYSATTSPLDQPGKTSTSTNAAIDHRRAHSFGGGAQLSRPIDLQDERHQQEIHSNTSSPHSNHQGGNNLELLSNSANGSRNNNTLPSIESPTSQNGNEMRSRPGVDKMRLPLPSVSTVPYSSDRSTSAHMPTTPLDDLLMHHHGIHASDTTTNSSSTYQNDGRILAPLRGVLRK